MTRPAAAPRPDLHSRVTDAILADLERGVRPWTRPWSTGHPAGPVSRPLRATGEPYRGINVVILWAEAAARGYAAPIWMTFRQALALGGCVRKGEHGATVVYASALRRPETDEDSEDAERPVRVLKAYTVFNVEQVEGLPPAFCAPEAARLDAAARIGAAEVFFARLRADIRHGGDLACYAAGADQVRLPAFEAFEDAESYYATLAHECVHWTGHPARLGRDFGRRFGDADYAREELVAELGAAFLCADLGLELRPREDHAAYIGVWLATLAEDKRLIFAAAAHAQRAIDFLQGLQSGA